MRTLQLPVTDPAVLKELKIGESLLLSGTVYTARDAAHKKMSDLIAKKLPLPVSWSGQAVYYTGPCPAPEGKPIGSCGPTTSSRMDAYTPALLDRGLKVMIGKGERNENVIEACKRNGAVYLVTPGGAGALLANCVSSCELVAFPELLSEAIYRLTVKDFPVTVAVDACGNDLFTVCRKPYRKDVPGENI